MQRSTAVNVAIRNAAVTFGGTHETLRASRSVLFRLACTVHAGEEGAYIGDANAMLCRIARQHHAAPQQRDRFGELAPKPYGTSAAPAFRSVKCGILSHRLSFPFPGESAPWVTHY